MRPEVEKLSKRYLEMENDRTSKEKLYFPVKQFWRKDKDSDDLKFSRAMKYLIDQMTHTVPIDRLNLTYRLINMIFFGKYI